MRQVLASFEASGARSLGASLAHSHYSVHISYALVSFGASGARSNHSVHQVLTSFGVVGAHVRCITRSGHLAPQVSASFGASWKDTRLALRLRVCSSASFSSSPSVADVDSHGCEVDRASATSVTHASQPSRAALSGCDSERMNVLRDGTMIMCSSELDVSSTGGGEGEPVDSIQACLYEGLLAIINEE